MKKILILGCLLLSFITANSQAWKQVRHEFSFGVGASNFLGDLGGSKGIGTHGLKDLKMRMTRPTVALGYKYMLSPYFSVKGSAIWSLLSGDDAVTKNSVRNTRNLSFRSNIGEFAAFVEYYPNAELIRPRYKIKGVSGNNAFALMPYFFTGIGVTIFNPKANYNGKWIPLQPLGTEGQGLAGRPEKYQRVTIAFPIGIGAKYLIDRQWTIGFELSLRYTTTDYMDDVSTSYYMADEIANANGVMAGILSDRTNDPSKGITGVQKLGDGRNNYFQRGNPRYNDAYMFGIFSVHYRLVKGQTFIPKF